VACFSILLLLCLQRKCEQYWPEGVGQSMTPPDTTLQVTFTELMPYAEYEIRKFKVRDVSASKNSVSAIPYCTQQRQQSYDSH